MALREALKIEKKLAEYKLALLIHSNKTGKSKSLRKTVLMRITASNADTKNLILQRLFDEARERAISEYHKNGDEPPLRYWTASPIEPQQRNQHLHPVAPPRPAKTSSPVAPPRPETYPVPPPRPETHPVPPPRPAKTSSPVAPPRSVKPSSPVPLKSRLPRSPLSLKQYTAPHRQF